MEVMRRRMSVEVGVAVMLEGRLGVWRCVQGDRGSVSYTKKWENQGETCDNRSSDREIKGMKVFQTDVRWQRSSVRV